MLATCLLEQYVLIRNVSPSARRRHVALATAERFAVVLIAGRLGTDPHRPHKETASSNPHKGSLTPSHSCPLSRQSMGEGRLLPLRQLQPPSLTGPFRRHQDLPLSTLSTRNPLILP